MRTKHLREVHHHLKSHYTPWKSPEEGHLYMPQEKENRSSVVVVNYGTIITTHSVRHESILKWVVAPVHSHLDSNPVSSSQELSDIADG